MQAVPKFKPEDYTVEASATELTAAVAALVQGEAGAAAMRGSYECALVLHASKAGHLAVVQVRSFGGACQLHVHSFRLTNCLSSITLQKKLSDMGITCVWSLEQHAGVCSEQKTQELSPMPVAASAGVRDRSATLQSIVQLQGARTPCSGT